MMAGRAVRTFQSAFTLGWVGILALTLRTGATALDVTPEHLLGMIPLFYMAAWGPYFLISPRAPIAKAARFTVCTSAILAALAAFEVPGQLGFVDYRSVFSTPMPAWRSPENDLDADLIFVRKGHQCRRLRFQGGEVGRLRRVDGRRIYKCDLRVDRFGFRNPTDHLSADVVVLGDSFVEGLHVADSELISERLAGLLGRTVVNLGRSGYGPQQELHVLRRYGVPLRPRTCIWAFYEGNDLSDSAQYGTLREFVAQAMRERPSRSLYGRSLTRNALSFAIRNYLTPLETYPARRFSGRFVERSGQLVDMLFFSDFHDGKNSVSSSHGNAPEMDHVRSVLAEAHALCASQGIDLIVLFVPAKLRIYAELCDIRRDFSVPSLEC